MTERPDTTTENLCPRCGKGPSEHSVVGYTVVCKPGVTDLDDDDD